VSSAQCAGFLHCHLCPPLQFSILKQRLARRLQHEGVGEGDLDLVSITKAAERTITTVKLLPVTSTNWLHGPGVISRATPCLQKLHPRTLLHVHDSASPYGMPHPRALLPCPGVPPLHRIWST
jgi:hypothetical protein